MPGGGFAQLAQPRTAAVAANGDVYFTDTYHHQIRRLDRAGVVSTIAGNGYAGSSGDGGPATEASLDTPHGIAVDNRGHVFIADSPNHHIRMVDLATGTITTVAGTGQEGFGGDGGPATAARLNRPRFLIVAPDGSLLIADTANYRVRRVDPAGTITTIAGTGQAGYSGDGGPATAARLDDPRGLALDAVGNLYVSNAEGSPVPSVRRINPVGIITTVAGGRPAGFGGDGGPATEARLHEPRVTASPGPMGQRSPSATRRSSGRCRHPVGGLWASPTEARPGRQITQTLFEVGGRYRPPSSRRPACRGRADRHPR